MSTKNKNFIISKELFCKALRDVEDAQRYNEDLNEFFGKHGADGYVYQPDCSDMVLLLLHTLFEKDDQDDIGYFCFELDFGKKYKKGCIMDGKKIIDFSSAEKLYDYLTGSMETDESSKDAGGDES